MLFPVKIKRYLIYKNVDFALFISIKIILTTNNAINYTNLCRACVNIHRVSSEKWWKQSIQCLPIFFYQNLVFQTFENMTFLYLYIYKQPTKCNESDKKLFLIKEICYKNR